MPDNKTPFAHPPLGLAIEPLDPLFFRDGRPFGGAFPGVSGLPTPRTLAGMLRWQLIERTGADPARVKAREHWLSKLCVRGPWLATLDPDPAVKDVHAAPPALDPAPAVKDVYVAPPAHLVRLGKDKDAAPLLLAPLHPDIELPGWREENPVAGQPPLRPLWAGWTNEAPAPVANALLNTAGLKAVLAGIAPPKEGLVRKDDLFVLEGRTGVGIDPATGAAQDSLIYTVQLLRLREHVGFYAEVGIEGDDPEALAELRKALTSEFIAPFGGEGRRVAVRPLKAPHAWPQAPADDAADEGGFASILLSPVAFQARSGATPPLAPPSPLGTLVALAAGRGATESGWHLGASNATGRSGRAAGVPRPARSMLAPGTTHFWQRGAHARDTGKLPALWQLAQSPMDAANGEGLAARARWRWWTGP